MKPSVIGVWFRYSVLTHFCHFSAEQKLFYDLSSCRYRKILCQPYKLNSWVVKVSKSQRFFLMIVFFDPIILVFVLMRFFEVMVDIVQVDL